MNYLKILSLFAISALLFTACSDDNDSTNSGPNTTGHLQLRMTDAPAAYDEINISFTEIEVKHEDDWYAMLLDSAMTINLLEWNNGQSIVVGEGDFPPGAVKEVRLHISSASIVVAGVTFPMDLPSGASSGLKIKVSPELMIDAGASYVLMIDFDAQHSIVTTGPPANPNGYKLKPVIRAVPVAITGSISGIVSNPEHYAVVVAKDSTGTDTGSTNADMTTGTFVIGYMPAGTYSVVITDTLGHLSTTNGVVVNTGQNTDIGTVTLQ